MAYSNEIRSSAQSVSSRRSITKQKFTSAIENKARILQSNWKGELSEAFRSSYNKVKGDSNNFFSDFGALGSKLGTFANDVARAEKEDIADEVKNNAKK